VDDPSLPEIARLTTKGVASELGVAFGEDLGGEDRVVGDVAGAPYP
jgi:hypothetical protein